MKEKNQNTKYKSNRIQDLFLSKEAKEMKQNINTFLSVIDEIITQYNSNEHIESA